MNPMKAYETAKSLSQEQLMSAMKGGIPEIPAYIAASVAQEQKKVRDSAQSRPPADKRTVVQELEQQTAPQPKEEAPVGIAALPQMAQGGEDVPEGGIAGSAVGGQVEGGPTEEIKELSKNDKTEKLESDYAEYKASGGTATFGEWMASQPKKFVGGGEVDGDDMDDLEREYAEYAALQGYDPEQQSGSAPFVRAQADATPVLPTTPAAMPFTNAITHVESKGQDFDKKGNPLKSSSGALFARQVMPSTAANPGFGIKPAASVTPEEYNRVGVELEAALDRKYDGNKAKVAAAYNAGQGTVDKAVRAATKAGDPDNWREYMRNHQSKSNFGQTYDYVNKVAGLSGIRPYAAGGIVKFSGGSEAPAIDISAEDRLNPTEAQIQKKYNLKPGEISFNPEVWIDSTRSNKIQAYPWSADEPNVAGDIPFSVFNNSTTPAQDMPAFLADRNAYVAPTPTAKAPPTAPTAAQQTAPADQVAKTTAPVAASSDTPVGLAALIAGGKDYDRYKAIMDADIPELDPKYQAKISKEQDRLEKDRSGNFDRTLIDVGLGIMSGTSPHALVNAGTGGLAGLKNMDARLAGYDKRGDTLDQRDLMLAQAQQARAAGNVTAALKLEQGADKLNAFAMKAMQGSTSSEMQLYKAWKVDNPNGTVTDFMQEISGAKNAPKTAAKLRENFMKDQTNGLLRPNETYEQYVLRKDPQFAKEQGYEAAPSVGRITQNGTTIYK